MGHTDLKHFPTDDALAVAAAQAWIETLLADRAAGRRHLVALSGGRIARKFFTAAVKFAAVTGADFGHAHFFWADERCVPPNDAESNFRLARECLLEPARVPPANIHRIPGELEPATAARQAEAELRAITGQPENVPQLDLVLLGLGEDGHVASLFPGQADTEADLKSVFLPVWNSPKPPPCRVTLGHGPLAAARAVWVLAAGAGKAEALRRSLAPDGRTPLARVIQQRARTEIFFEAAAMPGFAR
ncbi:MAG: 6-phosphogluconolactonase [Limisphaerales bacterium]